LARILALCITLLMVRQAPDLFFLFFTSFAYFSDRDLCAE
jgi:hypothetical protein